MSNKLRKLYKEDRCVLVEPGSAGEKEFINLGFKEEQSNKKSQKPVESNDDQVENKPAPRRCGRRKTADETAKS